MSCHACCYMHGSEASCERVRGYEATRVRTRYMHSLMHWSEVRRPFCRRPFDSIQLPVCQSLTLGPHSTNRNEKRRRPASSSNPHQTANRGSKKPPTFAGGLLPPSPNYSFPPSLTLTPPYPAALFRQDGVRRHPREARVYHRHHQWPGALQPGGCWSSRGLLATAVRAAILRLQCQPHTTQAVSPSLFFFFCCCSSCLRACHLLGGDDP